MDSVATEQKAEVDDRFDTARITAAVDALAEKHQGREDTFRTAMAQLLKAELIAARAAAQAILLKDRHGRRCAERLWPRPDGAGIRHRSAVHPALQADRLG